MIYTSSDITYIIVFVTFVDPILQCTACYYYLLNDIPYIVHNILYVPHYHC